MKFEVTVSGWEDEGIEDSIVSQVVANIVSSLNERVTEAVESMVHAAADTIIRERLTAEIDAILSEGWTEKGDGTYDKHPLRKLNVRDKINEAFEVREKYGRYEQVLPAIIRDELTKKWNHEVEDGIKRLRAKMDEVINTTIEETITGDIRAKIRKAIAC